MAFSPKTKRKIAFIHMNDDSQKSSWREDEENIFYIAENLTGLWREIRITRSTEHMNTKSNTSSFAQYGIQKLGREQ